jgi:hypothetical protein
VAVVASSTPALSIDEPVAAARPAGTTGRILLPPAAAGHRVFLDERVATESHGEVVVPCGAHKLRIGSAGKTTTVEVPCGSDLDLKQ